MEEDYPGVGMQTENFLERHFCLIVVLLCLGYLSIQFIYIMQREFNPDEVQGAYVVHNLKTNLPYRDFKPYKTVLGYYAQLPMMYLSDDPWTGLLLVRGQMVLINATLLITMAWFLSKKFRKEAVCLGLFLLVTMSYFLERSSELRVDMLTSTCGVVSLLLLLDRRFVWSGIACALSFFVSQKGIYYVIASDIALAGWMLLARDRRSVRNAFVFNVAMFSVLVTYIGFWSTLSSISAVVNAIFFSHYAIAFTPLYDIRLLFWVHTLWTNPLFYFVGLIAVLQLFSRLIRRPVSYLESILLIYSVTLMALGIWHKQPWPYFFVILIPTIFILHVSFFHLYLNKEGQYSHGVRKLILILIVIAALLPLYRLHYIFHLDNGYQRHMIELLERFLGPDDGYVDGMDLMYKRKQAVRRLRWIDHPRKLNSLRKEDMEALIRELDEAPIKLIVYNVRIAKLTPPIIHDYLLSNFAHLWGNIYIYTPRIEPGLMEFSIKFSGTYLVETETGEEVSINGQTYHTNDRVRLQAGCHQSSSQKTFRLKFLPEDWEKIVDQRYFDEKPLFMAFRHIN